YKDDDGKVYVMSAKCTHAKCIVHWNNAEKSWDCPCHGGRFDATGNVKNGPPTMALETRSLSDVAQPVAR
ncbi:MAG: Rieske 2Fe-2S domain-containing protein, partial [Rhizobacter sp.]|nr:Rieske 2Fe-2S domain-containing protein [Chlorobiales bacterium]